MKRIDDLVGATVTNVYVTSSGTLRIHFKPQEGKGGYRVQDWDPMIVQIPSEPKKKARRA